MSILHKTEIISQNPQENFVKCFTCKGNGTIIRETRYFTSSWFDELPCPDCKGTKKQKCLVCKEPIIENDLSRIPYRCEQDLSDPDIMRCWEKPDYELCYSLNAGKLHRRCVLNCEINECKQFACPLHSTSQRNRCRFHCWECPYCKNMINNEDIDTQWVKRKIGEEYLSKLDMRCLSCGKKIYSQQKNNENKSIILKTKEIYTQYSKEEETIFNSQN